MNRSAWALMCLAELLCLLRREGRRKDGEKLVKHILAIGPDFVREVAKRMETQGLPEAAKELCDRLKAHTEARCY